MSDQGTVKSSFTKSPNILIYGRPDLSIQEKWALLALIGMCWSQGKTMKELEGPYKLSLREIATITGVDHTSLRNKEGKKPRVGILDHLQSVGYVTVIEAKPIDTIIGKEGRSQTYLYIHLAKIWDDNIAFTEEWSRPASRLVSPSTFNQVSGITVDQDNTTVDYANTDVDRNNSHVDHANHTVDHVSTNLGTRLEKTIKTLNTKEEESATLSSPALLVWNIWCEAQGYKAKGDWTKLEHTHCETLVRMSKEAGIDLTPELMNKAREKAQAKQSFLLNNWSLKNLINALPDYFKQAASEASQQQQTALEQEDPNKLVLGTRYRGYEDFTATADLWFLFEMMPLQEAEQQLRMFNRDRVNGYQENRIREKLDASDEATKRGLIEQWLSERMAVAV